MSRREIQQAVNELRLKVISEARRYADERLAESDPEDDDYYGIEPRVWEQEFLTGLQRIGFAVHESLEGPVGPVGAMGMSAPPCMCIGVKP